MVRRAIVALIVLLVPALAEARGGRGFSIGLRGYDREQVDKFVGRVNQVIAELQITAAPESAIRHALKQVTDETQGLLERAHETAEDITGRSRDQAESRIQQAEEEARQLGVADRVRFLTGVPDRDLPALYNLAEIYLGVSRLMEQRVEGFGISLAEASACGIPVIAGRSGGIPAAVAPVSGRVAAGVGSRPAAAGGTGAHGDSAAKPRS